ncbi:hypothetical protein JXO52_06970 [bacterium]|nr:hypothetical protein [bacterium]
MKRTLLILLVLAIPAVLFSRAPLSFEQFFLDATMRVDFFITGDADEEVVTIDEIYVQGPWAGNPDHLIDPYIKGAYFVKLYDIATNRLIFSRGFDCIFSEYKTTNPAIEGVERAYHHSALFPEPKRPVRFVLEMGDRENVYRVVFTRRIDPKSVDVRRETPGNGVTVYKALAGGDPHHSVDLAWIAEGYAAHEMEKFKRDVDRYVKVLFSYEPYKSYRNKFTIYGIFVPSAESGVDQPRKGAYVSTAVNASFNAFHIERYLLTEDNKAFRNLAAAVPYDAIVIMVNSDRYGGGGIYNYYGLSTVDHELSEKVFVHEFGHSFAGLADEYYTSDVAYNEFYPPGVEPAEPNITALLDPEHVKWEDMLSPGVQVPTDWGKERVEKMQATVHELNAALSELKKSEDEGAAAEADRLRQEIAGLREKITETRDHYLQLYKDKVGVFEGAGYASEGLYRPEIECLMFSNGMNRFCAVCRKAIERMILYYTGD